jgi:hypothetical protein
MMYSITPRLQASTGSSLTDVSKHATATFLDTEVRDPKEMQEGGRLGCLILASIRMKFRLYR